MPNTHARRRGAEDRLEAWGLAGCFRRLGVEDVLGGGLPAAGRATAWDGPYWSVGLLQAPPGDLENSAEAPLTLGGGGVLAGGVLPTLPGGGGLPVEVLDHGPEASDLLLEPAALSVDEACEPVLGVGCGGGGLGQIAVGLAAFPPPAVGGDVSELVESCPDGAGVAGGVPDRPRAVGAGGLVQVSEALARLGERGSELLGLLRGCGRPSGVGGGGEVPAAGVAEGDDPGQFPLPDGLRITPERLSRNFMQRDAAIR